MDWGFGLLGLLSGWCVNHPGLPSHAVVLTVRVRRLLWAVLPVCDSGCCLDRRAALVSLWLLSLALTLPREIIMKITSSVSRNAVRRCALALVVAFAVPGGAAMAQGAPQSITAKRVDVVELATGYRASKLIGAEVMNGDKDQIGTVDDVIVSPAQEPYAILSVGGFLGIGTRLVAVPFKDLQVADKRLRMDGATKDSLRALPEFRYAKD